MLLLYPTSAPRRRAFTLTEILVVIAIIAILVALIGAGMVAWFGGGARSNSERVIRAVNSSFQKQYAYVVDQAKRETPSPFIINFASDGNPAGNDPGGRRAQVVWIKVRLMEALPMCYGEINDPTNTVYQFLNAAIPAGQRKDLKTYTNTLNGNKQDNSAAMGKPAHFYESAACLLMSLSVSRGGTRLDPDSVEKFITDTDGDGVKELVDGSNTPLFFYRFAWNTPGNFPDIQALNPGQGKSAHFADALDPDGTLLKWGNKGNRPTFENLFHRIGYTNQDAYYVTPVILSVNKNQTPYLLNLPGQPVAAPGFTPVNAIAPAARDNVYSFNLKGS